MTVESTVTASVILKYKNNTQKRIIFSIDPCKVLNYSTIAVLSSWAIFDLFIICILHLWAAMLIYLTIYPIDFSL